MNVPRSPDKTRSSQSRTQRIKPWPPPQLKRQSTQKLNVSKNDVTCEKSQKRKSAWYTKAGHTVNRISMSRKHTHAPPNTHTHTHTHTHLHANHDEKSSVQPANTGFNHHPVLQWTERQCHQTFCPPHRLHLLQTPSHELTSELHHGAKNFNHRTTRV